MTRSVIDPITRIEGHMRVDMEVENGVVKEAWVSGGSFRGMEKIVEYKLEGDEKAKFDESVAAARNTNAKLGDALK